MNLYGYYLLLNIMRGPHVHAGCLIIYFCRMKPKDRCQHMSKSIQQSVSCECKHHTHTHVWYHPSGISSELWCDNSARKCSPCVHVCMIVWVHCLLAQCPSTLDTRLQKKEKTKKQLCNPTTWNRWLLGVTHLTLRCHLCDLCSRKEGEQQAGIEFERLLLFLPLL